MQKPPSPPYPELDIVNVNRLVVPIGQIRRLCAALLHAAPPPYVICRIPKAIEISHTHAPGLYRRAICLPHPGLAIMGRNNKTGGRMLHQPTTSIASHQLRIFQLGSIRDTCYFPHVALAPTEPTRNCSATVMHCHFSTRRIGNLLVWKDNH